MKTVQKQFNCPDWSQRELKLPKLGPNETMNLSKVEELATVMKDFGFNNLEKPDGRGHHEYDECFYVGNCDV